MFCLLPSVFNDKKSLRSHRTVEIKVFINFFACWWKDPDPGGHKTYGHWQEDSQLAFSELECRLTNHVRKKCIIKKQQQESWNKKKRAGSMDLKLLFILWD